MPCFFARLLIVSPAACPRRSCSNSSTLPLLSIPEWFHPGLPGWAKSDDQSGPNQSIELTGTSPVSFHADLGQLAEPNRNRIQPAPTQDTQRRKLQNQRSVARGY